VVVLFDDAHHYRVVEALTGERLLDALRRAQAPIIPACGGRACCGGCRIRVEPIWRERLDAMGRSEKRLLPHLEDPQEGDRLSCQITLTPALDGLIVHVPPKATNLYSKLQSATGES
jgi:2Fe-2S ferredoxin